MHSATLASGNGKVADKSTTADASTWPLLASCCGRFGTHGSNENFTSINDRRRMFVTHFNAGRSVLID
jgi:hypothetical protein